MLILPRTEDAPLVRTAFGNEDAWVDALSTVLTETEDGFRAYVKVVDDIAWDRVGWAAGDHSHPGRSNLAAQTLPTAGERKQNR
jgi:hypothetical protein